MLKSIKNLKTNDTVEDVYFLKKKELALTQGGKPFLKLTLSDKTGRMEAKVWENAEAADEMVATGQAVFVQGRVDSFKGDLQIRVDQLPPLSTEYSSLTGLTVPAADHMICLLVSPTPQVSLPLG